MPRVSTYINCSRNTEAAFNFYRRVFGTEFNGPIARFGDMATDPSRPPLSDADKNLVMHVELPILGGHILMGTDAPESMGFRLLIGNNMYVNLEPDSRAHTMQLFNALSQGGKIEMGLADMPWGGYFGCLAYQAHAFLLRELGAAKTSVILYLGPVYAALAAWLLLGETLYWYHWVGAAMVLPGVFLSSRTKAK